jgi:hypothetical protein
MSWSGRSEDLRLGDGWLMELLRESMFDGKYFAIDTWIKY